jgi:hypothetical protein
VLPLLAYNTATGGHPFAFTQAGEFRKLLSSLLTPASAWAQPMLAESGGAFRFGNLRETLPASLALLGRAFGGTALLVAVGSAWALRVRRSMAAALLPYPLLAVPFYGCWSHADPRYLTGAVLCLIPLAATAVTLACRWLADPERAGRWRWPVLVVGLVVVVVVRSGATGVAAVERALVAALVAAVIAGSVPRARGMLRPAVAVFPAVALLVFARARATLGPLLPRDAVLITSEALGRPAENIAHYLGVPVFYVSELPLLRTDQSRAALLLAMSGRRPFFLLGADEVQSLAPLRTVAGVQVVARRRGPEVLDWFVDPRRGGAGVALYELTLSPAQRELLRGFQQHVEGEL